MEVFKDYANYYDLLYQDKNYQKEAEFIDLLIKKHQKNSKKIIEFGCGSGKHATLLNKKGYQLHSIDLSAEMIKIAKKNEANDLKFNIGDVRNYDSQEKFDCAISLFHVASYQNSNQDFSNYLKNVNQNLKEGGIFIFDFWYGPAVLHQKPEKRQKTVENNKLLIKRDAAPELFVNENLVNVNYQINIKNKEQNKNFHISENHKMRYFFLPEIEFFLSSFGFKMIEAKEWLTEKTPTQNSWGVYVCCSKI